MYNEFVRYFERMGELYKELIKTNERMTELYKDIQRINLDWLDLFWKPWLSKEQEKKDNTPTEGKTQNIRD
jgi:hypothetical protein